MSFSTLKATGIRKAFTVIELILDKNDPALDSTFALDVASCGTPKTTGDPLAFTGVDFRTYRYSDQMLFGVNHFPGLVSASSSNPRIDPGKSIGMRATANIQLKDFKTNDAYELPAPYDDRRVTGSHFLKLFARNHLKNRRARIIRGYFDEGMIYDEANCQIENYIIDSFSYPDDNGNLTISLIDELILVESKKAKAPTISIGTLSADITDVATTLSFTTTVTEEYGAVSATGRCEIEKELLDYTVDTTTTMTVVRGVGGTTAKAHSTGESIQKAIFFNDENIIDIITTLITDHTRIPASYIPTADWAALKAGDLADYNLTRTLYKPEDVKKLLNELVALAGLSIYVDVVAQSLVIVTVPDFASPIITFNEDQHLEQSTIRVRNSDKEQITRQTIHWDKFDTTESDDIKNYRKHFQVVDGTVETVADISNVSEAPELKTNWLVNSVEDNKTATNFAQRAVSRFSQIPIEISFEVDSAYIGSVTGGNFWLGSIFTINTKKIVDSFLNNEVKTCQCVAISPGSKDGAWRVTGLTYIAAAPITADLYISEDKVDYLLTDDLTTDTAKEYVVVIKSGVKISSSISGTKSFDQGTFFAGATLKLINLGSIFGRGGNGGIGGDYITGPTYGAAGNGSVGQLALNITTDATIDNGFGQIFGGGGGAGGYLGSGTTSGNGGGGGQGFVGGIGGVPGITDDLLGNNGANGSLSYPGGNGGEWGEVGGANAAAGGSGGDAINQNGNTVTITAGNNSEQIKGAIV